MLDKILKPTKTAKRDVKAGVSSANNIQPSKMVSKNVFKIEEPKVHVEEIKEDEANDYQIDHFSDDIDFSAIDEHSEKKVQEPVKVEVKIPEPVPKQPESADVKVKAEIKSTDIFENIRPNWENAFNMEDDDDAELVNAVADEAMSVDEKQVSETVEFIPSVSIKSLS